MGGEKSKRGALNKCGVNTQNDGTCCSRAQSTAGTDTHTRGVTGREATAICGRIKYTQKGGYDRMNTDVYCMNADI